MSTHLTFLRLKDSKICLNCLNQEHTTQHQRNLIFPCSVLAYYSCNLNELSTEKYDILVMHGTFMGVMVTPCPWIHVSVILSHCIRYNNSSSKNTMKKVFMVLDISQ